MTRPTNQELRELIKAATPGVLAVEGPSLNLDNSAAHYAIRTAAPDPQHPHSPRYVAWLCGSVCSDVPGHMEPKRDHCDVCGRWWYRGREIPVDVRHDAQIEADAALLVAAVNSLAELVAENEAMAIVLRSLVDHPDWSHASISEAIALVEKSR